MRLQRLRVSQFRRFRGEARIDALQPGINVFAGPNESGKSTLVRAIRSVFLERYKTSSVADLQPWGDSGAAPEVEVAFTYNEQQWTLTKRFLKQARCDLQIDNERLTGEEAESKIAEVFGFGFAGKGASSAPHWGVPGLLWIQQGDGQNLRAPAEYAAQHLRSALGVTVSEVASSGGEAVIDRVNAMLGEYTTSTGKPRGALREVENAIDELQQKISAISEKRERYRSQVDWLSELRKAQHQDDQERPWESMRRQQREAEQKLATVRGLEQQQEQARQQLQRAETMLDAALAEQKHLEQQRDALQQRKQESQKAEAALEQVRHQVISSEAARVAAKQEREARHLELEQARSEARRIEIQKNRTDARKRIKELETALKEAERVERELSENQKNLRESAIGKSALEALREKWEERERLRIRRESIATRLRYDLQKGQRIELADQVLEGSGEQLLVEEIKVRIEGVGELHILPGGEEVAGVSLGLEQAESDYGRALQELGVATLQEAQERFDKAWRLEAAISAGNKLLGSHAPNGIQALRDDLEQQRHLLSEVEQKLEAMPPQPLNADAIPTVDHAEHTAALADRAMVECEAAFQEINQRQIELRTRYDSAIGELQQLQTQLEGDDHKAREEGCSQRVATARSEVEDLQKAVIELAERIKTAQPEILEQDMRRFEKSAREAEETYQNRRAEIARHEREVQLLGAEGLDETHAEKTSELNQLMARHAQLRKRVAALQLLSDLLKARRDALNQRLQEPLQKHLERYLGLLFPSGSARLQLDDQFLPKALTRDGDGVGDLHELSLGLQEQIGLIGRLAYADMLQEAGHPTLIILDDTLVHSDAERLTSMKRLLFDAATRHQVLLFTCHPESWRDMGVTPRDMRAIGSVAHV